MLFNIFEIRVSKQKKIRNKKEYRTVLFWKQVPPFRSFDGERRANGIPVCGAPVFKFNSRKTYAEE